MAAPKDFQWLRVKEEPNEDIQYITSDFLLVDDYTSLIKEEIFDEDFSDDLLLSNDELDVDHFETVESTELIEEPTEEIKLQLTPEDKANNAKIEDAPTFKKSLRANSKLASKILDEKKQRIRYKKEQYYCGICCYTCTIESSFLSHINDHWVVGDSMPKFSCEICGKDVITKDTLVKHKKIHMDGTQYCCDLCSFQTVQLKKLIQHRRKHTGERPHKCPYCSYRSSRRDNLHSHARRVHNIVKIPIDTFTSPEVLYPNVHTNSQQLPQRKHKHVNNKTTL